MIRFRCSMSNICGRWHIWIWAIRLHTSRPPVTEIIGSAILYTLGFLSVTTILTFVIGIFAGALLVWRGTPRAAKTLITIFLMLAPIPYYLLAMILIFLLAFTLHIFPTNGITTPGRIATGGIDLNYFLDILYHSDPARAVDYDRGCWRLDSGDARDDGDGDG